MFLFHLDKIRYYGSPLKQYSSYFYFRANRRSENCQIPKKSLHFNDLPSLPQITEHKNRIAHFCPQLKHQHDILKFKVTILLFITMNEIMLTRRSAEASWKKV